MNKRQYETVLQHNVSGISGMALLGADNFPWFPTIRDVFGFLGAHPPSSTSDRRTACESLIRVFSIYSASSRSHGRGCWERDGNNNNNNNIFHHHHHHHHHHHLIFIYIYTIIYYQATAWNPEFGILTSRISQARRERRKAKAAEWTEERKKILQDRLRFLRVFWGGNICVKIREDS